jgi:hypothetical protein
MPVNQDTTLASAVKNTLTLSIVAVFFQAIPELSRIHRSISGACDVLMLA